MSRNVGSRRDTAAGVAIYLGGWLAGACLLWVAGQVVWGMARAIGKAVAGS